MKYLLQQIKLDWNSIEDNNEMKILEKYANENRLLSLILFFVAAFVISFIIIIELIPVALDAVIPMNKSRPRKVKIDFEFFIDEEQYFYIYLIYEVITILIGLFTILATGTLSFMLFRHCCASFKIASNIIENTVTKHTLQISYRKTHVMYQKIIRAVHIHRKSARFSTFFLNIMNKWYFALVIISVMSLSCNLFRLLNALILSNGFSEITLCIGIVVCHFIVMFVTNFVGQSVIDHYAEIFNAAYNTMWYLAPLSMQKLLLFVMQNSLKAYTLTIGHIYVTSLEGFSTMKYLLKQIKLDWNSFEDESEIRILKKYAIENRLVSIILSFCTAFSMFSLVTIELTPIVLDAVIPMNKSRPRKIKVDFEFFIDQEQYFYIYLIHEIITMLIGVLTVLAIGTLSLGFFRHCCATFKIARYNTMWYIAPLSIQKLLLFVMQNSLKAYTLTIGHIYVTSLEGFSTVT
ncbi:hypothetical protein ALC60_03894 [Trachymyrmex zeteki]|uniref:Odorant receptor n=1 Tax=Mycetomoellerius zeteki TaxID=64791 RepID=A0A151XA43_9HYME|nr:hypothetical protein ALC60_03894 [Trachymyrmex zeteki]